MFILLQLIILSCLILLLYVTIAEPSSYIGDIKFAPFRWIMLVVTLPGATAFVILGGLLDVVRSLLLDRSTALAWKSLKYLWEDIVRLPSEVCDVIVGR